jgi:RNA polymerase primary sigma factor
VPGREPTNDEIAATLGISQKKLSDINILRSKPISLNQSIPGNDKGSSLYEDIIKQPNEHSIENKLIGNELDAALKTAIKKLKPDLQKIINLRFGFVDGEPKSFEEIGQIMGKSREVIRIKEKKALLFISSFLK